jgi:hypothetical protein
MNASLTRVNLGLPKNLCLRGAPAATQPVKLLMKVHIDRSSTSTGLPLSVNGR